MWRIEELKNFFNVKTHKELADALGVTQSAIDAWKNRGNLPAKYLIHAVPPRWLGGEKNEPQLLCNAYSNALLKANQVQAKTVSFPNLGTGIYKYPLQQAAEFAIGSIMMTLPSCEAVDEVFFVCYEKDNYEIYKEILENLYDENIQIEITAIAK